MSDMEMVCPSCGCTQPSGILCSDDEAAFATMLAAVPALVDQLQIAISKQARVGAMSGKGGLARERSPINFGALAARDALLVEVALWSDVTEVRRHPQAGEIVAQFGRAVKDAYRVIDRAQDRQYLGTCLYEEDGATCHAELWAREGAHEVRCGQCEQVHPVRERQKWLLAQAADMLVTAKQASRYLGKFGGITVTEASIRGLIHRERLAYRAGTTFRLGDLLEVLADMRAKEAAA